MSGIVRLGKAAPAYIDRWKTTCGACNEHFEITNADLLNGGDQKEPFKAVACPDCKRFVVVSEGYLQTPIPAHDPRPADRCRQDTRAQLKY